VAYCRVGSARVDDEWRGASGRLGTAAHNRRTKPTGDRANGEGGYGLLDRRRAELGSDRPPRGVARRRRWHMKAARGGAAQTLNATGDGCNLQHSASDAAMNEVLLRGEL